MSATSLERIIWMSKPFGVKNGTWAFPLSGKENQDFFVMEFHLIDHSKVLERNNIEGN